MARTGDQDTDDTPVGPVDDGEDEVGESNVHRLWPQADTPAT